MIKPYTRVTEDGKLELNLHAGQKRAWLSKKRIVAVLAGTQGGKTSFGKDWLRREIQIRGPGDYMVVAPTFQLLAKKALPEFRWLFEKVLELGKYKSIPTRVFEFSEAGCRRMFENWDGSPTNVYFGHAADPDSLESATAKGAWLDEAGQSRFKVGSWEAIMRRVSYYTGRVLITTTPYNLGWLKQKIYDPWVNGEDQNIDVINFRSIDNPGFPREEYERARRELPGWKFNMFYNGQFERPAGLIYDSFKNDLVNGVIHRIPRFVIPNGWDRFVGLDYGGINTVAMFYARDPGTGKLYAYREYKAGKRTAKQHAKQILKNEPGLPSLVYGGAPSEIQWRREFRAGGLPVRKPVISDVELGIDRVWGAHAQDMIYVFDDLSGYLDEKMSYSRVLDENGEPTEKIENKNAFHHMDAERYIISALMHNRPEKKPQQTSSQPVCGEKRYQSMRGRL